MKNLYAVQRAYEAGEGSLRELAERFSVSLSTLKKRSAQEKWSQPVDHRQANGVGDPTASTQNGTACPENGTSYRATGSESGTAANENGTTDRAAGSTNGTAASGNGTTAAENGTAHEPAGAKTGTTDSEKGNGT